jgi:uncharacterized membrane protein YqiK
MLAFWCFGGCVLVFVLVFALVCWRFGHARLIGGTLVEIDFVCWFGWLGEYQLVRGRTIVLAIFDAIRQCNLRDIFMSVSGLSRERYQKIATSQYVRQEVHTGVFVSNRQVLSTFSLLAVQSSEETTFQQVPQSYS